jgi:hypothetical protein
MKIRTVARWEHPKLADFLEEADTQFSLPLSQRGPIVERVSRKAYEGLWLAAFEDGVIHGCLALAPFEGKRVLSNGMFLLSANGEIPGDPLTGVDARLMGFGPGRWYPVMDGDFSWDSYLLGSLNVLEGDDIVLADISTFAVRPESRRKSVYGKPLPVALFEHAMGFAGDAIHGLDGYQGDVCAAQNASLRRAKKGYGFHEAGRIVGDSRRPPGIDTIVIRKYL